MAIGFLSDKPKPKVSNPTDDRESPSTSTSEPAPHVIGKPVELEPRETASIPQEAPEAAAASAEAPDAGYGRCTESSNWEERGRSSS